MLEKVFFFFRYLKGTQKRKTALATYRLYLLRGGFSENEMSR